MSYRPNGTLAARRLARLRGDAHLRAGNVTQPQKPHDMPNSVRVVSTDDLRPGAVTPGVTRELALEAGDATVMRARAEAGATSGWHHHGTRHVLGYVVQGRARFEFGPAGTEAADVEAGGFFHVPAGLVHRDINPADGPQEIIMTVVGSGPLVVNVDGPDG